MQLMEGCTLVELTEDRIVQDFHFGKNGKGVIRHIGNPNPPQEERQKTIDKVYDILYKAHLRNLREKAKHERKND